MKQVFFLQVVVNFVVIVSLLQRRDTSKQKNLYIKRNRLHSSQLCATRQMIRDVLLLPLYFSRMLLQGQCCLILAAGRRLKIECKYNLFQKVLLISAKNLTLFLKENIFHAFHKSACEFTDTDFDIHLVSWKTNEHVKTSLKILKKGPHRSMYLVAVCMATHWQLRVLFLWPFSSN